MSHSCQHEHDALHDHSHDHDHHTHEVEAPEGDSLFQYIDTSKLRVLNAEEPELVAAPFKSFHERNDRMRFLSSNEDDPELILFIPFTEAVSIKSICLIGGEDGNHPKQIKL
jgi:hypothetical protein